jgi:excinuclease Cho
LARPRSRVSSVGLIVLPTVGADYAYPDHIDRASLDALPKQPGVYLFRDDDGRPLYIGKSVDIRNRVLSHLRTPAEAALLAQSARVDFQCTAGEIGALLLESRLIKAWQPPYNALLKSVRETWSLTLSAPPAPASGLAVPGLICASDDLPESGRRFGLFSSRIGAETGLAALLREHGLCPAVLGFEKVISGRACFAHQIGRCRGACAGKESPAAHAQRLLRALEDLEDAVWPHAGPVGIVEQAPGLRQVHVVDRWSYLGTLEGRRRTLKRPARIHADADTYRILAAPLRAGRLKVVECETAPGKVFYRGLAEARGKTQPVEEGAPPVMRAA